MTQELDESADLVGAAEAANMLGIDRSGVTRRVQMGQIVPAMRLHGTRGAYLFHRADIEQLVAISKKAS